MNFATSTSLERLRGIVGGAHVEARGEHLAAYAVDGVTPTAAVRPAGADEVAEVVRFAAAEKLGVIPMGSRTKLGIGMPPARYDIALDLTRLNRVVAYDEDDLTLSVEAGMRLADLAPRLAEHEQFLPLAVPFTAQTTIGGTIATGVDSPLRQSYGTARDFVLGVEFVTGEGVRTKSGGRVVKNVAGYDLHKMMIGALGTLGVMTSVNFRTFPLAAAIGAVTGASSPASRATASRGFVAAFPTLDAALAMRQRILESPLQPLTLEILSPSLAQLFHRQAPTTLGETLGPPGAWLATSGWTLAAGFGGNGRVLARYAEELRRLADGERAASAAVLDDTQRPLLWGRLRECLPMMLESAPDTTIFKITALGGQFGRLLRALEAMLERRELPQVALVRSAGVVYLAVPMPRPGAEGLDALREVAAQVIEHAAMLAEHVTIPWCPLSLKRRIPVWGPPRGDFALMEKMKRVFDPHRILNPGRYVGGL